MHGCPKCGATLLPPRPGNKCLAPPRLQHQIPLSLRWDALHAQSPGRPGAQGHWARHFCALDCPFRRLEARNAHFERFALRPTPQMLYLCLPGNRWEQALAGAGCARQGGGERENPQPPSPAPKAPVPFYHSTKCAGAGGCPTSPRRWDATQKPMEAGLAPGAAICCAVQCGRKPKLIALATFANAEGGCGTRRKPPNAWYHSA